MCLNSTNKANLKGAARKFVPRLVHTYCICIWICLCNCIYMICAHMYFIFAHICSGAQTKIYCALICDHMKYLWWQEVLCPHLWSESIFSYCKKHCPFIFDNKKYCVKKYCAPICVHLFLATMVADATLLPCSFRGRLNRVITSSQCIKKANSRLRIFRFLFKMILISIMNIISHGYSQWTVILVTFSTPASTELSAWNIFCHLDIFIFTLTLSLLLLIFLLLCWFKFV